MLLIKNANLYNMAGIDGEKRDILIDDAGRIVEIAPTIETCDDYVVVDAAGRIVTPGLVDPHCHIGLSEDSVGWNGDDVNESTHPVMPHMRGLDAIKDHDRYFGIALRKGITTVCTGPGSANIFGGTFCVLNTYGADIFEKTEVAEHSMKMALGENPRRVYGHAGKEPKTRMASAAMMREWLTKARDYKELWDEYETDMAKYDEKSDEKRPKKPTYDVKLHAIKRLFEGLPCKIHAHQSNDITTALQIAQEFDLKVTIDHCTEGYMIPETLKKFPYQIIIGPTMSVSGKHETRNLSFESGRILHENGILFSIMTDHPVIGMDHTIAQLGQFAGAGLPWLETIKAITINAARTIYMEDELGSIEVGKRGDVVVWSGDPLHYMTKAEVVVAKGKVVVSG